MVEMKTAAGKISRIAAVVCVLALIGTIILPELWIAFAKFTVQNDVPPFAGSFGCYPDKEPCCLEGYNRTAYTERWAYPNANVSCIYIGYPVKEILITFALIMLIVAFVSHIYGRRKDMQVAAKTGPEAGSGPG
jgi:hypothetical protein